MTSLGFETWTIFFPFTLDAFLALVLVLNLFLDILPVRLTSVCYQTWTIDSIFILHSFPEFVLMMNLGHYITCAGVEDTLESSPKESKQREAPRLIASAFGQAAEQQGAPHDCSP